MRVFCRQLEFRFLDAFDNQAIGKLVLRESFLHHISFLYNLKFFGFLLRLAPGSNVANFHDRMVLHLAQIPFLLDKSHSCAIREFFSQSSNPTMLTRCGVAALGNDVLQSLDIVQKQLEGVAKLSKVLTRVTSENDVSVDDICLDRDAIELLANNEFNLKLLAQPITVLTMDQLSRRLTEEPFSTLIGLLN